jgi:hypothetical protein
MCPTGFGGTSRSGLGHCRADADRRRTPAARRRTNADGPGPRARYGSSVLDEREMSAPETSASERSDRCRLQDSDTTSTRIAICGSRTEGVIPHGRRCLASSGPTGDGEAATGEPRPHRSRYEIMTHIADQYQPASTWSNSPILLNRSRQSTLACSLVEGYACSHLLRSGGSFVSRLARLPRIVEVEVPTEGNSWF